MRLSVATASASTDRRRDLRGPALAIAAGLAWALSMPPVGWWPLTFLVVPLLGASLLVSAATGWRAFGLGTLAGGVAFAGILTWLVNIEPGGPIAWPLLSLIEGLYVGLFAALVAPLLRRAWWGIPTLGFGWVGLEFVRGRFPEHGFGWAEISYAHVGGSWLAPLGRIGGGHLITLVVALMGAALFEAFRAWVAADGDPDDSGPALAPRLAASQPPLFVFAGLLLASVLATVGPPASGTSIDVLVVQGNDQERPRVTGHALDVAIATRHLELTREAVAGGAAPDVIVWPESAIDRDPFVDGHEDLRTIMEQGAALSGSGLVVGITRQGSTPGTFRNTASHITPDGSLASTYVKRRLVPFGEYVPARRLLGGIGPLRAVGRDGEAGTVPGHLRVATEEGSVDLAVMICFETVFGDTVRGNVLGEPGDPAAGILVSTTNDASFGRGSETAQHLAQSRLRAIETGRWVVHAAISGSSAFVAPDGTVHQATGLFEATTLRADVPVAVGLTPYLRVGDVAGRLGLAALAAIAMLRLVEALRRRRRPTATTEGPAT